MILAQEARTFTTNFSKYVPSATEIAALKADYWRVVEGWTPERILGAMGYINLVTFKIAMECDALVFVDVDPTTGKNIYEIDYHNLGELLETSANGRLTYQVATKGVRKYLMEHWDSAANSMPTLRKIRESLSVEMGLFTYERIEASGRICDCPAPQWRQIDFVGLLLLQEVLEEVLVGESDPGVKEEGKKDELPKAMPPHRGFWTVMLYNAVFAEIGQFRRARESEPLFSFCYPLSEDDYEVAEDIWDMVSQKVSEQMEELLEDKFYLPY